MARDEVNIYTDDETVTDYGAETSAAADAAVATIASGSLPAGIYEVEAHVSITGTTVAADDSDNMEIQEGGTAFATLPVIVPSTSGSEQVFSYKFQRKLDGSTALSVNVGATTPTTSSEYRALLTATRVALVPVVL